MKTFEHLMCLPHSKAKDQGHTAACWAFSVCSYIETEEAVLNHKECVEAEYSPWSIARQKIATTARLWMEQKKRIGKRLPAGAMAQTAWEIIREHGLYDLTDYDLPECKKAKSYRNMMRGIQLMVRTAQRLPFLKRLVQGIINKTLDSGWGKVPALKGEQTRVKATRYIASHSTEPFHQDIVLPVPDNYQEWTFHNLPIDELLQEMKQTLLQGHSLLWQGCVRKGFSMEKGLAEVKTDKEITDQLRRDRIKNGQLTDDHMMHIIGLAQDEGGETYFIAKNSLGDTGPYHGRIYMSEKYMRLNTVAIMV